MHLLPVQHIQSGLDMLHPGPGLGPQLAAVLVVQTLQHPPGDLRRISLGTHPQQARLARQRAHQLGDALQLLLSRTAAGR
ncbi:hypothetical protein [Streptomyces sp. KL116D]|uniref:hypothetical protein n=1 Tax=Streptomyces sp. KL116D TaxID=3045152 RepID=UPI003556EC6B